MMNEEKVLKLMKLWLSSHVVKELTWQNQTQLIESFKVFLYEIRKQAVAEYVIDHHTQQIKELQDEISYCEEVFLKDAQ